MMIMSSSGEGNQLDMGLDTQFVIPENSWGFELGVETLRFDMDFASIVGSGLAGQSCDTGVFWGRGSDIVSPPQQRRFLLSQAIITLCQSGDLVIYPTCSFVGSHHATHNCERIHKTQSWLDLVCLVPMVSHQNHQALCSFAVFFYVLCSRLPFNSFRLVLWSRILLTFSFFSLLIFQVISSQWPKPFFDQKLNFLFYFLFPCSHILHLFFCSMLLELNSPYSRHHLDILSSGLNRLMTLSSHLSIATAAAAAITMILWPYTIDSNNQLFPFPSTRLFSQPITQLHLMMSTPLPNTFFLSFFLNPQSRVRCMLPFGVF